MNLNLLLVDDSPAERELAREAVAEFATDITLEVASSAEEAMRLLTGGYAPHLALIDLHLGGSSGRDLVIRLLGTVRSAILTTTDDPHERTRCLAAGACDFLVKPLRFDDFPGLLAKARALALS